MRPGLVSLNSCQEKDVGGLSKKGNTARTTQIANISTFNQKANRMKYSVSDTLDPAQNTLHIHDPLTCTYTACACVDKTCRHGTGMTPQITHNARHPFDSMSTPLHNPQQISFMHAARKDNVQHILPCFNTSKLHIQAA